jgi:ribonuclease VapC
LIVVDTSVIIACIAGEPQAEFLLAQLMANKPVMGAPTLVEAELWIARHLRSGHSAWLNQAIDTKKIEVFAFTADMALWSRHAVRTFGKGSGHAAGLNFGDCLTYGVAKSLGAPLLFVGDHFDKTDLMPFQIHPSST